MPALEPHPDILIRHHHMTLTDPGLIRRARGNARPLYDAFSFWLSRSL